MKSPAFLGIRARSVRLLLGPLALALLLMLAAAWPAAASHSWGNYHWARTSNPFTLRLASNLTTPQWGTILANVSADWSSSGVLDTLVVQGNGTRNCKPTRGRVEVCNGKYGFNGWLGLATIWPNSEGHITQATAKVNDSYFNTSSYNDPNARRHVLCQEVGHTFGLGHQYAVSCMNDRDGLFEPSYVAPNAHDLEQLVAIYSHTDSTSTLAAGTSSLRNSRPQDDFEPPVPSGTGREEKTLFEYDLGSKGKVLVWVFWARPVAAGLR